MNDKNTLDYDTRILPAETVKPEVVERKLKESEERYRSLVSAIAQIVWIVNADGLTTQDMEAWQAFTGQSAEDIKGPKVMEAIHPDDRDHVTRAWKQAMASGEPYETEYRLRRRDGVYRLFSSRGIPILEKDGSIREWVGVCTDITERKQLEDHLRASERRFRTIFEQAAVGIAYVHLDGHWLQVNQKLCDILGYTNDELQLLTFQHITHPDDLSADLEHVQRLLRGEIQTYSMEKRYFRKDGSLIWANLTVSLTRDETNAPQYFISVVEDISARKCSEEQHAQLLLREQAARAEAEASAAKLTILQKVTDTALAYLSLENVLNELIHRIGNALEADSVAILLPTEDEQYLKVRAAHGLEQELQDALAIPIGEHLPNRFQLSQEPMVISDLSRLALIAPFLLEKIRALIVAPLLIEGKVIGIIAVGTMYDRQFQHDDALLLQRVADRIALAIDHIRLYEAEQVARTEATRRAQRLEAIVETIADGLCVYDGEGHIVELNKAARELLTFDSIPDFFSLPVHERVRIMDQRDAWDQPLTPDTMPPLRILRGEIFNGANAMETTIRTQSGKVVRLSISGAPLYDVNGRIAGGVSMLRDVTERYLLEQQVHNAARDAQTRASELQAILESMADAVLVYDRDGHIIFTNAAAHELLPLDTWPGHTSLSAEERAERYALRDENDQPISPSDSPVHRLLRGEAFTGAKAMDVVIRARNGNVVQLSMSGSPMRDSAGNIIGAALIAHDVTVRRTLARRTHNALEGLLRMAEALVQLPENTESLHTVGSQLAELTCNVLDCKRVGIQIVEPVTEIVRPLAVTGLPPEQEQEWWASQQQEENSLLDNPMPEIVTRLRAGEVQILDLTQAPFDTQPNPYDIKTMLVAPMAIGERLIGLLTLDYNQVKHTYSQDEIALASAVAKLSALVIERQRLLTERAEAQGRELALREANQRMEEFLGIASHELRTPLTTIKANVQLALRRLKTYKQLPVRHAADDKIDEIQNMLWRAERQIGVLNRLVSDMVDISRIQLGNLQLHIDQTPCDLLSITHDIIQEQRIVTPGRIILLKAPPDTAMPVIADCDRIGQVLTNYLSNALKYSSADKPVTVELSINEQIARVSVHDEGPGLPSEEQERVWNCFYQSPDVKVLSGSGVGLGLGLYISQTIIKQHRGQVGVHSVPERGSTFWFTLPVVHAMDATVEERKS